MRPRSILSFAALLLLAGLGLAFGQSPPPGPQIVQVPALMLPPTPPVAGGMIVPQLRQAPKGMPGFYDPATGRFTPLADAAPQGFPAVGGAVVFLLNYSFVGLHATDTVLCTLTASYGNYVNGQFFSNHATTSSINFAVGDPENRVTIVDEFTPTSAHPYVQASVSCQASDENGVLSEFSETQPAQPLANGSVPNYAEFSVGL
jgi:hypothetical protein